VTIDIGDAEVKTVGFEAIFVFIAWGIKGNNRIARLVYFSTALGSSW
jgi:hypothetical protein